eukprot:5797871-Pyramimonas_sp.AAC.1
MKLFHSAVTPTALHGCGSWVMTVERDSKLEGTQLKMARAMLGRGRKYKPDGDVETWMDWVRRVTMEARQVMKHHDVPIRTEERRSRLQRWSERL